MATGSQSTNYGTISNTWYLKIATGINPSANEISAITWCYSTNTGNYRSIYQQENGTGVGRGWLYIDSTPDVNSFLGGSGTAGSVFVQNTWEHCAVTFPSAGSPATITIYLDGTSVATRTETGEGATGDLRHGANKSGSDEWAGYMAFSLVYNRGLTGDEINEVMWNPYAIPNGLQWAPDELDANASTFTDKSPAQRGSATITGSPAAYAGGGPPVFLLGGQ